MKEKRKSPAYFRLVIIKKDWVWGYSVSLVAFSFSLSLFFPANLICPKNDNDNDNDNDDDDDSRQQ